jgi:hypothetical protein
MSTAKSRLRKPDAQFIAFVNSINGQCNEHKTEWNIDVDSLTTFDTLLAHANSAYEANHNPALKNHTTAVNKKAAFDELIRFMGQFINYLEANLAVPEESILAMGLRPRTHYYHRPLPPPPDRIALSFVQKHDEITVYAARPKHDHSTSGTGPAHYHGFAVRYKIEGEAKYQTEISTRLRHTIHFDHADVGKRVFISAAWVNPRLEPGPWSDEFTEIII